MPKEINITGWDFSELIKSGRMRETPLPWDYGIIVREYLPSSNTMLDLGTGGGEFLSSLATLPENTFATEGYEPNIAIAKKNLEPLGVKIVSGYDDNALPFENDLFDLVINRHEYYSASEVYRILKPGGYFITQQVKGNCDNEIIELFNPDADIEFKDWCLDKALKELSGCGFEIIIKNEAAGHTEFTDTEAFISYLRVISWLVPDFSVEKYSEEISKVKLIIVKQGCFSSSFERFLLLSTKPT